MLLKPIFLGFLALFCIVLSCTPHSSSRPHIIKSLNGKAPHLHHQFPATQVIKTIYVDDNFTDDQRASIRDSVEEWTNLSNGLVRFNVEYDYQVKMGLISHKIVMIDLSPEDELTQLFDKSAPDGMFLASDVKQYDVEYVFLVADRIDDPYMMKIAVERQIGHLLGMSDIPNNFPAVMNSIENPKVPCMTIFDMQEFCRVMLCSIDQVRYCQVRE